MLPGKHNQNNINIFLIKCNKSNEIWGAVLAGQNQAGGVVIYMERSWGGGGGGVGGVRVHGGVRWGEGAHPGRYRDKE